MAPLSFRRVMKSSVWIRDTLARVHWCLTVSAPSVCKDIRSFDDNDLQGLYTGSII